MRHSSRRGSSRVSSGMQPNCLLHELVRLCVPACLVFVWVSMAGAQFVPDSSQVDHPAARHVLLDNMTERNKAPQQLLEAVAEVMALDEATVLDMISKDNGFGSVRCPACSAYVHRFDISDPDHIACVGCGKRYPNEEYPETYVHEGFNQLGEPVQWRYYAEDGRGYQYFFSAVLRQQRHYFLEEIAKNLARLYEMTGDEQYARRAIVVIVGLAEASPHWSVREDHPHPARGRYILSERPWEWRTGVWGNMVHSLPINAIFAYDLTYNSPVWEQLGQERGQNVSEPVENWFRDSYRMAMEYQEDRGNRFGNLHPYAIRHIVALGRVLNDPDMVHSMVPWFAGVVESYFGFDGMGNEITLDYHGQTSWNLGRAMNAIAGYADPEGYVDTRLGISLRDADMAVRFPILARAREVSDTARFPDGSLVTIHDTTWHRHGTDELGEAGNIELNAAGHFALGRGSGEHAMQVHLHFCPLTRHSHYHTDRLSLILWAAGGELLADIGYARDPACYRYFATNRLSHTMSYMDWYDPPEAPETEFAPGELNTTIWARSAFLGYESGALTDQQVQLVAAESPGPQWQAADLAQRLVMLIATDDQRSYVFDIFRLRGGDFHESILRPSADEDCEQVCSLDLAPRTGTLAGEDVPYDAAVPGSYGYRNLIHDLQVADGSEHATLTWTTETTRRTVRSFLMGEPDTEFILARAPLVRPANNIPAERDNYHGPYLLRRRDCGPEVTSRFAAVYDAWPEVAGPVVDRVEWLQPEPAADMAVAVRVHIGDRQDTIYISGDETVREVGDLTVFGAAVVASKQAGQVQWAYVWGGGVTGPGFSLTALPTVVSPLRRVLREKTDGVNGFEIPDMLPETLMPGSWLRVIHGDGSANGYRIERIEPLEAGSRIIIDGLPGFEQTDVGMRMQYFPHYEIPGAQQVEIVLPAFRRFGEP